MKEFNINPFLSLRLEEGKTNIYIRGVRFIQCKYLLITIPNHDVEKFEEIDSIDEVSEVLDHSLERTPAINYEIDSETEFWAHCSNLQAWYENDYDTRIIHRNLAFHLLRKLADLGDNNAYKRFKEEVAKRFDSGFLPVQIYLIVNWYITYLTEKELELIIDEGIVNLLLKEKPNDYDLKLGISRVCGKIGLLDKALEVILEIESFLSGESTDTNRVFLWTEIARIYYDYLNDTEKAIRIYEKVLTIDSENNNALYLLGRIYLNDKEYNEAKRLFEAAIETSPEDSWSFTCLGITHHYLGDLRKAQEMYEKAIQVDPYQTSAHSNLAQLHFDEKNYDKSLELCKKELELHPDHYEALYFLGRIYLKKRNYASAIKLFERALRFDDLQQKNIYTTEDIHIWKKLCKAYIKVGDLKKAHELISKILKIEPENQKYRKLLNLEFTNKDLIF